MPEKFLRVKSNVYQLKLKSIEFLPVFMIIKVFSYFNLHKINKCNTKKNNLDYKQEQSNYY